MLTPVPMVRIEVLAIDRDLVALTERIGDMALLHPVDALQLEPWAGHLAWTEMEAMAGQYVSVSRRFDRLAEELRLSGSHPNGGAPISPQTVLREVEGLLDRVEPEVKSLVDRALELEGRLRRLEVLQAQLEMLSGLEVDLAELRNLGFLYMVSGLMPPENVERLEESLQEIPHVLIRLRRVADRALVFAFSRREEAQVLDRALRSAYLERMEIPPELSGRPAEAMAHLFAWRAELERQEEALEQDREALRERWGEELREALVRLDVNARVVDLWRMVGRTERTRLLAGWVPRSAGEALAAQIAAATEGRSMATIAEPSPLDDIPGAAVPTALANPPPLRPFEELTRTYGLPAYWDLDPTPLAALLYVLMFGIMFGDVGQGAVLILAGLALAMGRVVKDQQDFGRILAACGISAVAFGVLYGSIFGAEGRIPALWLQPMADPLLFIGLAIALGVVVLSLGLIFGAATAWRRRDLAGLLLGQNGLVGLWLYWGLVAVALLAMFGREPLSVLIVVFLVGAPLALLLLHEPLARAIGWSEGMNGGVYAVVAGVEAFDLVIRFVSNTVSFLRLGAFSLAHASLGLMVFAIANTVHELPGAYLGTVVLGNVVIITLEALVIGIQALRLEYYEFFTKFLRGGGVEYRPFGLSRQGAVSGRSEKEA